MHTPCNIIHSCCIKRKREDNLHLTRSAQDAACACGCGWGCGAWAACCCPDAGNWGTGTGTGLCWPPCSGGGCGRRLPKMKGFNGMVARNLSARVSNGSISYTGGSSSSESESYLQRSERRSSRGGDARPRRSIQRRPWRPIRLLKDGC